MLGKGEEKPPEMQFNKSKVEQHRPCFNLFNSFSIPLLVQIARPCETAHGSWAPDLSLLSREINSVLLYSGRAEWTSLPQGEEKPHRNEDFLHLLFLLVLPHLCHPWTFFQKASLFLSHPQGNLHLAAALKSCFSPHIARVAYPGKPGTEGAWDKRKASILAHGNWVNELSRARGTMVSWVATDPAPPGLVQSSKICNVPSAFLQQWDLWLAQVQILCYSIRQHKKSCCGSFISVNRILHLCVKADEEHLDMRELVPRIIGPRTVLVKDNFWNHYLHVIHVPWPSFGQPKPK